MRRLIQIAIACSTMFLVIHAYPVTCQDSLQLYRDSIRIIDRKLIHRTVENEVLIEFFHKHQAKIDSQIKNEDENVKEKVDIKMRIERWARTGIQGLSGIIMMVLAFIGRDKIVELISSVILRKKKKRR